AREILNTNNANKKSSTLSSLNQVIFADDFMKCDSNLLIELDDSVSTARNQRLSFIMSCSNVSTLIGLLGTFAGLSITIGSIGNLLSTPSGVGGESSSNTLHMIVTMVASLSEPLKGMNTAFVSSIYGVVCAILLTSQSVFVRSSYALISAEIKRLKVKRSRASSNRQRSLRIESETLFEFKELFREFFDNYKSIELSRTQAEEKKLTVFSDGLSILQNKLSDNTV
ncbi:MotA/TolQ/ExbB proton channel family protein, partial [Salmonella enterica]|nr:MotA/TolQ/ExbB proton channel family protein [Salmonella enterica]